MEKRAADERKRPETGPMQFPEDWPGLFIRGDDAFGLKMHLDIVVGQLPNSLHKVALGRLSRLLGSSSLMKREVIPELQLAELRRK